MTRAALLVAAFIIVASWLGAQLATWADTLLSAMR